MFSKKFGWPHAWFIFGVVLMTATVVIGLIAVWTINKVDQGHLAGTAAILGIAGFVTTLASAIALTG